MEKKYQNKFRFFKEFINVRNKIYKCLKIK